MDTVVTSIPTDVVVALGISTFFTLLFPFLLLIFLLVKKIVHIKALAFGFLCFFATQMILRIPLMSIASQFEWFKMLADNVWVFSFLIGGLSAGLFEETGRYIIGKTALKNNLTYKTALSFGLGHAFCEVVLLMGMSNVSNFAMVLLVNGDKTSALGAALTPAIINDMVLAFTSSQVPAIYLGIVERVCATMFHIFATILVFKAVSDKKNIYYVYAILIHTLFNGISSILLHYTGMWVTEIFIVLLSVTFFLYIKKFYAFSIYNGTLE